MGAGVLVCVDVGVVLVVADVVAVVVAELVGDDVGVVMAQPANVPSRYESTISFSNAASASHAASDFTITNPLRSQAMDVVLEPREYCVCRMALSASTIWLQGGTPGKLLAGAKRNRPALSPDSRNVRQSNVPGSRSSSSAGVHAWYNVFKAAACKSQLSGLSNNENFF